MTLQPLQLLAQPVADEEAIRDFLAGVLATDIHLAAITPDGPLVGKWFGDDVEAALAWAAARNANGANLHFTANVCEASTRKKPSKDHISAARFAHVDVDPPKDGGAWDRAATLQKLDHLPIKPSVVINSGNGIQALWSLDTRLEEWGPVEALNRELARRLGGDNCHNIDRLLRLPGTVNFPNRSKVARGCVPVLASMISAHVGPGYALKDLQDAFPSSAVAGFTAVVSPPVAVSSRRPVKLLTTSDLKGGDLPKLRAMINTPGQFFRTTDRSNWAHGIACEMAGEGYSEDEVLGILLNPANAGAAHVTDQSNPWRAAQRAWDSAQKEKGVVLRQAQRAANRQIGDGSHGVPTAKVFSLDEMLARFVFIEDGSQVADRAHPLARLSLADFRNATAASLHLVAQSNGSSRRVPCADAWLKHPDRRSAETVTFKAGAGPMTVAPDGREGLNLWTQHRRPQEPEDWPARARPFVDHVTWLWSEHAGQFLDWLAHIEQRPGELPHFGWLHVSKVHGKGRGWLASVLVRLWPGNVAASYDLVGALSSPFNDRLSRCILVVVDEIHEGGNASYRHAQTLRQMVTSEHRDINPKYGRKHVEHNAARWLVFSNHVDALPLSADDRRFWVVDHDGPVREAGHYAELYGLLENPQFISSVAEFLRQRDISSFNPGQRPPLTKAKEALITLTRTEAETMLVEIAQRWPVDLITWREISRTLGDQTPTGPSVRHMTERTGLKKLDMRLRLLPTGSDATAVYALRNHEIWSQATSEALKSELNRIDSDEKQQAFYAENVHADHEPAPK